MTLYLGILNCIPHILAHSHRLSKADYIASLSSWVSMVVCSIQISSENFFYVLLHLRHCLVNVINEDYKKQKAKNAALGHTRQHLLIGRKLAF